MRGREWAVFKASTVFKGYFVPPCWYASWTLDYFKAIQNLMVYYLWGEEWGWSGDPE